jgi:hypothetical protein
MEGGDFSAADDKVARRIIVGVGTLISFLL